MKAQRLSLFLLFVAVITTTAQGSYANSAANQAIIVPDSLNVNTLNPSNSVLDSGIQIIPISLPISLPVSQDEDDNWGCAEWRNGICVKCSYRFVQKGLTCEPVNPLCKTWDFSGKCLTCYPGYSVCAQGCAPDKTQYSDKNCNSFDSTGKCIKCSYGSYLKNGVCTQVNPNCRLSDENNGQCLTCYVGYSVQAGQCLLVPSAPDNEAPSDILCAQWKGKTCVKCSESSYFNGGLCTQVNPLCKTFDNNNGACLSCYSGYILLNSDCVLAPDNKAPADILCAQWQSGVCTKCSQGAFFRSGVCFQSDPLCKTFDSVYGSCTSCFSGYYLFNGQCLISPAIPVAAPSDPACAKWQGSTCLQCSRSAYFKNGVCVESNTLCKTFDSTNGACTSCYYGYTIQGDNCVVANTTGNADPLCARWANGVCSQCAQSAYFSNGVCVQSNTFCKTFDSTNGACTSCYGGYDLANGDCVLAANPVDNSTVSDPNCAQWNGKVCVQCASDAFFQNGKCVEVDPLCKTWDNTNGNCLSCYKAFNLEGTKCVVAPNPIDNSQPSDILCAEWSGKTCLKCAQNAYFVNGVCNQANPLCKSYDNTNGDCLSCYNGYDLIAGKCVANNSTPTDKLCSQWNGAVCEKCSPFSYFSNGVCTQVDPKCKTFNSINGACTSCYGGYVLSNGGCNVDKSAPTDQLCAQWNGSVCVKCAQAAYFVNGICTQSNPQCRTFDNTNGNCLSCYAGYVLTAGNCLIRVQPPSQGPLAPNANFDVYCKKQVAGVCIECFFGFVLQNKKCVPNFDKVDCPAP